MGGGERPRLSASIARAHADGRRKQGEGIILLLLLRGFSFPSLFFFMRVGSLGCCGFWCGTGARSYTRTRRFVCGCAAYTMRGPRVRVTCGACEAWGPDVGETNGFVRARRMWDRGRWVGEVWGLSGGRLHGIAGSLWLGRWAPAAEP